MSGGVIVCWAQCWACTAGDHFEPPQWHTWADEEDVAHAEATNQADPRESSCGCNCCGPKEAA